MKFLKIVSIAFTLLFSCTAFAIFEQGSEVVLTRGKKTDEQGTVIGTVTFDSLLALTEQYTYKILDGKSFANDEARYFMETLFPYGSSITSYREECFYRILLKDRHIAVVPESWLRKV